jgi:hypothetical protein
VSKASPQSQTAAQQAPRCLLLPAALPVAHLQLQLPLELLLQQQPHLLLHLLGPAAAAPLLLLVAR